MCEPFDLPIHDGYHGTWPPALILSRYLKSSREARTVKGFQQVEKRGKFWERSGEQEKIVSLLPGRLSFFDLGPGVLE
jgi:hypothetical protein